MKSKLTVWLPVTYTFKVNFSYITSKYILYIFDIIFLYIWYIKYFQIDLNVLVNQQKSSKHFSNEPNKQENDWNCLLTELSALMTCWMVFIYITRNHVVWYIKFEKRKCSPEHRSGWFWVPCCSGERSLWHGLHGVLADLCLLPVQGEAFTRQCRGCLSTDMNSDWLCVSLWDGSEWDACRPCFEHPSVRPGATFRQHLPAATDRVVSRAPAVQRPAGSAGAAENWPPAADVGRPQCLAQVSQILPEPSQITSLWALIFQGPVSVLQFGQPPGGGGCRGNRPSRVGKRALAVLFCYRGDSGILRNVSNWTFHKESSRNPGPAGRSATLR